MEQRQPKKIGVIVGGSGLIGGTMMYYFKKYLSDRVDIYAPNSKKLSLREPEDIEHYFNKIRPDFIINSAIAAIDADPLLTYEVNYLGAINLARKACEFNIPYIYISSAAVLPTGENLTEDDTLSLEPELSNYAKSKLMAEKTLRHLHASDGLDYSSIRLSVVYGKHDHKIQGFHRMLFSIVAGAMPAMFTRRGIMHSYSNAAKLPFFIHHMLEHRDEFSGETYNFVDRSPVELIQLISTIRNYLELSIPKDICVPYVVARTGKKVIEAIIHGLAAIGVEARMPAELMFLKNFYHTQTLAHDKIEKSSFDDPFPEQTIFTELPDLIQYYLTRWEQLNLVSAYNKEFFDPKKQAEQFLNSPEELQEAIHRGEIDPFVKSGDQCGNR